jgi:uncharacterized damage-inducible protein DinB
MSTHQRTIVDAIARAFDRDLHTFAEELRRFPDEASLWATPPGAPNSAGNLAMHVAGNFLHFVGATLDGTGYVRDRNAEFGSRGVPRAQLHELLAKAASVTSRALAKLDDASLTAPFPAVMASLRFTTGAALVHLATHLAYHLGQVDLVRRSLGGDTRGAGAVSPAPLSDLPS